MDSFRRELSKACKRSFSAEQFLRSIPIIYNLIEDKIFLDRTLERCVYTHKGFEFSLSFMYGLKYETDREGYLVLDGVDTWFNQHNVIDNATLLRSPSLIHMMYDFMREDYMVQALEENPWIFTAFHFHRPRTCSALTRSVSEMRNRIESSCQVNMDDCLMPRGVWGIDYMFKVKPGYTTYQERIGDFGLIPLDEYLRRVTDGINR